jgi:hypothetical protein
MKFSSKSFFASLIVVVALISGHKVSAQVFPTASMLLSNHNVSDYTITSAADYAQLENSINILSGKLHDAFIAHPNLQYTPSTDNDEIVGYIITGVNNSAEANEISYLLMELEVLGDVARSTDEKYLPVIADASSARVSKREARH